MTREELIGEIFEEEWKMFTSVNNTGGRADCQDDLPVFRIMRHAQMSVLPEEVLLSYAEDISQAKAAGRNMMSEKYGYMMKYTFPGEYEAIKEMLPAVSQEKEAAASRIAAIFTEWTRETAAHYPFLAAQGRPVGTQDDMYSIVSSESYFRCELLTLGEKTLALYLEFAEREKTSGHNIQCRIMEDTMLSYGFSSLDEAENSVRAAREEREKLGLDRIATELCTNCR